MNEWIYDKRAAKLFRPYDYAMGFSSGEGLPFLSIISEIDTLTGFHLW